MAGLDLSRKWTPYCGISWKSNVEDVCVVSIGWWLGQCGDRRRWRRNVDLM